MTEHAAGPAEPFPSASDADLVEQQRLAVPELDAEELEPDEEVGAAPIEADPADAFEQHQPVPELDEYR